MRPSHFAVYVNAGNDRNGNPRRGWIVIDVTDGGLAFVDEGYSGRSELRRLFPDAGEVIALDVTPGAYRDLNSSGLRRRNPRARRTQRRTRLLKDVRFFQRHGGGVVGHAMEGGLDLARAERYAQQHGWTVTWEDDPDADWSWLDQPGFEKERDRPHEVYFAVLRDAKGKVLASLGGIFDPDEKYMRVVASELALEALGSKFGGPGATAALRRAR
jgi:hypothetical protein